MITPESPHVYGSNKFREWRPYQRETVEQVILSGKLITMLEAPTGTGKSIVGIGATYPFPNALYLCTTKLLQDQLENDFPDVPMMKGRSNYPCVYTDKTEMEFPLFNAEHCPLKFKIEDPKNEGAQKFVKGRNCLGECPYRIAKKRAVKSKLAILNTAYYMSEVNFVGEFADRKIVIVDEADKLEDQLLNFVECSVTNRMLDRLKIKPPEKKTKFESWKQWANELLEPLYGKYQEMVDEIRKRGDDPDPDLIKEANTLETFLKKLKFLVTYVDEHWVYIETEKKWTFKPIWVSDFGQTYLWDWAKRFVLMSATILSPQRLAHTLGIKPEDWKYISVPCQFPKENRKVVVSSPGVDLSLRNRVTELPKALRVVSNILAKHKTEKGLIHTVSYSNARYLLTHLAYEQRLKEHDTRNKNEMLEKFKKSKQPLVMVSPSMDRGIDLPYELCRFQIVMKVPFADLGDKQVAARLYSSSYGKQWYAWVTACTIVQMSGRSTRAVDDHSVTYIIDSNFARFYRENAGLFPMWWREALVVEG